MRKLQTTVGLIPDIDDHEKPTHGSLAAATDTTDNTPPHLERPQASLDENSAPELRLPSRASPAVDGNITPKYDEIPTTPASAKPVPLPTIPSFNDFQQLSVGQGLAPIAMPPVTYPDCEVETSTSSEEKEADTLAHDAYHRVKRMLESAGSEAIGGARSQAIGSAKDHFDGDDEHDHPTALHPTPRSPKVANFAAVAPLVLAELRRRAGKAPTTPGEPTIVTTAELEKIRAVVRNPRQLNPICPKDILETDLLAVKDRVDAIIDAGCREWKKPEEVAQELAKFIAPIMKRHADYDKDSSLFRKVELGSFCVLTMSADGCREKRRLAVLRRK